MTKPVPVPILEWCHVDGSCCEAGYMMREPFPRSGGNWWCTEDQKYLVPRNVSKSLDWAIEMAMDRREQSERNAAMSYAEAEIHKVFASEDFTPAEQLAVLTSVATWIIKDSIHTERTEPDPIEYPYPEGGNIVIGPETFIKETDNGGVISYKGQNYVPQPTVEYKLAGE